MSNKEGYLKVQKNKAYFMRYQTKLRRRRECKTDYALRSKLVSHFKTKYGAIKYRLVVRFTNKDIVAQVVYSKASGDFVVESAYAHQLKDYGIKAGFCNYASAYCVGLLLARRVLEKFGLAKMYEGVAVPTGEQYLVKAVEGRKPFRCFLDIGIAPPSRGSRSFAIMKGAVDGGLNVPHGVKKFHGFKKEGEVFDPAVLKKYITGEIQSEYMKSVKEGNAEEYEKQFSLYVKAGVKPEDIPSIYKKAHQLIRKNPIHVKKEKKVTKHIQLKRLKRLSKEERAERLKQKIIDAVAERQRRATEGPAQVDEENDSEEGSD